MYPTTASESKQAAAAMTAPPPPRDNPDNARQVLRSIDLLGSQRAIEIEHKGQRYRLQTTKAGKLILTK